MLSCCPGMKLKLIVFFSLKEARQWHHTTYLPAVVYRVTPSPDPAARSARHRSQKQWLLVRFLPQQLCHTNAGGANGVYDCAGPRFLRTPTFGYERPHNNAKILTVHGSDWPTSYGQQVVRGVLRGKKSFGPDAKEESIAIPFSFSKCLHWAHTCSQSSPTPFFINSGHHSAGQGMAIRRPYAWDHLVSRLNTGHTSKSALGK